MRHIDIWLCWYPPVWSRQNSASTPGQSLTVVQTTSTGDWAALRWEFAEYYSLVRLQPTYTILAILALGCKNVSNECRKIACNLSTRSDRTFTVQAVRCDIDQDHRLRSMISLESKTIWSYSNGGIFIKNKQMSSFIFYVLDLYIL